MNNRRKCLVVGSTGGMGEKIVELLIKNDYYVVAGYNTSLVKANYLKKKYGENIDILYCNLLQLDTIDYRSLNDLTDVIIAAGKESEHSILACTETELMEQFRLHVSSPLLLLKTLISFCELKNIVFISSNAATKLNSNNGAYALSKAGVNSLVKLLDGCGKELQTHVNCITPGWCDTDMSKRIVSSKNKVLSDIKKSKIDGKIVSAEEIANLCLFLLSDIARHIHGQIIEIDSPSKTI